MDTAQYYLFVVIPAYRVLGRFTWMPVLGPGGASLNYRFMRCTTAASRPSPSPAGASARRAGATTAGASSRTSRSTGRRYA